MFGMEIGLDRDILESNGYDWEYTVSLLTENFNRAGFKRTVYEDTKLVFNGSGSDKDFSYSTLIVSKLIKQEWFKKSVKSWWGLKNNQYSGDYIEIAKKKGMWK